MPHPHRPSLVALGILAVAIMLLTWAAMPGGAMLVAIPLYLVNPLLVLIAGLVLGAKGQPAWPLLAGVAAIWSITSIAFVLLRNPEVWPTFGAAYLVLALTGWVVGSGLARLRVGGRFAR